MSDFSPVPDLYAEVPDFYVEFPDFYADIFIFGRTNPASKY